MKEARELLLEDLVHTFINKGKIAARVTNLSTMAVDVVAPTGEVYTFELAATYHPKYDWETRMEMYDAWRGCYLEKQVDNLLKHLKTKGEQ